MCNRCIMTLMFRNDMIIFLRNILFHFMYFISSNLLVFHSTFYTHFAYVNFFTKQIDFHTCLINYSCSSGIVVFRIILHCLKHEFT